ncbi:Deoxyadenosine/deoxycytidine kinase [Cyclobacterium lianum]|uniref:Deoxyadenosine/deoxycytidine kinase n=1 Tax=Cyclobacterium lianum TaxID=388280 RepID=A0A1M7KYI1_9BACT|nr:deoxynucleoside kinase [Cyclobacterium lianum]SHM70556.1 Deoxyadenosine/deoxycytidine kinase [Cyclobacterium lianum]
MHIAVSGNIGSGKTTLVKKLASHYNWQAEFESVEENPYLEDFYENMQKWSFHLQVYFLHSRFNQNRRIQESSRSTIQDRTIYEDAHIFAANLFETQLISNRDYSNYLELYRSMEKYINPPDLLVYLKADIPKLVDQIEKRGRQYEKTIQISYLKSLNDHYKKWISAYRQGKLLVIDVNEMDFVENREHFSEIVSKIDREIFGLFT